MITALSLGTSTSRMPKLLAFQPGHNLSGQRKRLFAKRSTIRLFDADSAARSGPPESAAAGAGWLHRTVPARLPTTTPHISFSISSLVISVRIRRRRRIFLRGAWLRLLWRRDIPSSRNCERHPRIGVDQCDQLFLLRLLGLVGLVGLGRGFARSIGVATAVVGTPAASATTAAAAASATAYAPELLFSQLSVTPIPAVVSYQVRLLL